MIKKKRFWGICITVFILFIVVPLASRAAVPQLINYQGELIEDGSPVNGFRSMTFSLWETASGGTPSSGIWYETQSSVEVTDGIYNVQLGSVTALPTNLSIYDILYLQVNIVHPTYGPQKLEPLLKLTSTVFSIKAGDAENLEGHDSSYFSPATHDHDATYVNEGETNSITADMIQDATITSADLGINSIQSDKIADNAVTDIKIADSSVTSNKIANGSITAADMQDGAALAEMLDNDGTGSGLDADLLDGHHSTDFMSAAADNWVNTTGDTMTGDLTVNANITGTTNTGTYSAMFQRNGTQNAYGALKADTESGRYGAYINNQGGYNGINSYGLYVSSNGTYGTATGIYSEAVNDDFTARAFEGHANSTSSTAYGLNLDVDTSGGSAYGIRAEIDSSAPPNAYGSYLHVTKSSSATGWLYGQYTFVNHAGTSGSAYGTYGSYLDVNNSSSSATGILYGQYINVLNAGTSGTVYGNYVNTHSSDTYNNYGGYFAAYSNISDTGGLYGIRADVDNNTTGSKYAGYFYKYGGGNYAGYFSGNVNIIGSLTATSKSFVQPHKSNPTKEIVYVSLEGPEHAVFIRGTARLENGEAFITMPEHWQQVVADEGITVNLTPEGAWAPLYVASKSKSQVVVRVAEGGPQVVSFSYYITAQRDGFQEHEVVQENKHFTADGISAWEFENQYTENTLDNRAIRAMLQSNGILNTDGRLSANTASTLGWKITPNEEDPMYLEAHGKAMPGEHPEDMSPAPRPSHDEP